MNNDFALLVGITHYPGIHHLNGPANDVANFRKWLLKPDGGNLDEPNIKDVVTDLGSPPDKRASATPIDDHVLEELSEIRDLALEIMKDKTDEELKNEGRNFYIDPETSERYLGRRLYLYFSGHGFSGAMETQGASLIMANGDYDANIFNHVNGVKCSDWFQAMAYFREVVVLMDCCRTIESGIVSTPPFREPKEASGKFADCFYGFSGLYGTTSREDEINGQWQGIFTALFLDALENAIPNERNEITWSAVRNHVFNNRSKFSKTDAQPEPQMRESDSTKNITLAVRNGGTTFTVIISFPADLQGKKFQLATGKLQSIGTYDIGAYFTCNLRSGLYKILFEDDRQPITFEVQSENRTLTI